MTNTARPAALPSVPDVATLMLRVRAVAAADAMAPAVCTDTLSWGYGELAARVDRLSRALRARGLRPGARLGLLCEHCPEALVALLAALDVGVTWVPIDPDVPMRRLEFIARDAGLAGVVTQPHLLQRLADTLSGDRHELPDGNLALLGLRPASPEQALDERVHPEELAYVIYTSGSTGTPKGVMVPRRGLANYLAWCTAAYTNAASPWRGALVGSSLAVDLTLTGLLAPLWVGASVVLLAGQHPVERWLAGLNRADGPWLLKVAPTQLALLVPHLTEAQARSVATLVIGGEALPWSLVHQWWQRSPQTRVFNEYGPTETVVGSTFLDARALEADRRCVPIGKAIASTRVYVASADLRPCAPGAEGELWIGGAGVARGYVDAPALTAARFMPDPLSGEPGARLYRTGDLGRTLPDGALDFLGRGDDQVKVHGHRVEPREIEAALVGVPGVASAAVTLENTGAQDPDTPEAAAGEPQELRRFVKPEASAPVLVAYLVMQAGQPTPVFNQLRRQLGERLPSHMLPSRFVSVSQLPLLPSGKIDRAALHRTAGRTLAPAATADAPRNEVEATLCALMSDALGLATVGVHDNFFELGCDSIRVIGVHARAQALGVALELPDFFKYQTIAQLGQRALRGAEREDPAAALVPYALLSDADRARLPAGLEDAYPLARMQAGLLFHSQESKDSANYHDVFVYQVRARFDERALQAALVQVVLRHPLLRTSFALSGFDEPLQLVWPTATVDAQCHDLRALDAPRQQQALTAWISAEKNRHFDLGSAPLLRVHLHRTADDVAHWGLSFHDVILDGWSLASLLVELLERYAAELQGRTLDAPRLQASYRQFVEQERAVLQDDRQRAFWQTYLHGYTAAPPALGRRPSGEPRACVVEVAIDPELSDALQAVARLLHVPVKYVLLAAHMHVLARTGGHTDVLTGLESHGRVERVDGERVLGMHLNTLPLRLTVDRGTWSDLIDEVHEAEQSLWPYRRYPYAAIVRQQGGAALFNAVFNYTHFHVLEKLAKLPGLEPIGGCGFGQRHYALSAEFNQDPYSGHLRLDLECNLEAGSLAYWQTIGRCYEHALRALASDPMAPHDDWAAELAPPSTSAPDLPLAPSVVEQWLEHVATSPTTAAVVHGTTVLTYEELHQAAGTVASRLRAAGITVESRVGVWLDTSVEQIVAVWGILLAGAAYVPLDVAAPITRVFQMLVGAQVHGLVTTSTLATAAQVTTRLPGIALFCDVASPGAPLTPPAYEPPHALQLAYVIHTSGSSGGPKAVQVPHGTLACSTATRRAYYGGRAHTLLLVPGLAYDSSVAGVFGTLCSGGTLVLPDSAERNDPDRLLELIQSQRVSMWLSVPALYEALLRRAADRALDSLRAVIVAGEACPARLAALHRARCGADLHNEYGPSETTVWATVQHVDGPVDSASVPIGQAISGVDVYVLDTHLRPLPAGVPGEIYIGGAGVSRGYGQAAPTAERFLPDPFAARPGARMYRTGDRARRLPDGALEFVGRIDRQVKVRGYRIELAEVEDALRCHDAVQDVAVVALRNDVPDECRLVAYVVAGQPAPQVPELRRACAERLPAALIPGTFVLIDELPRTENGKVDLRYLAEVRPGLHDPVVLAQLLAQVEALRPDEVQALLSDLTAERPR